MKKNFAALGLLGVVPALAIAQSSVTLYGVVDVNIRSVHHGDVRAISMSEGTLNASRVGFKGAEDLGGGLKATFVLEAGLHPDDGIVNKQFFNRRSTISLKSERLGELRLGHDNIPIYNQVITFDPFGGGGVSSVNNLLKSGAFGTPLLSGAKTFSRADNTATYFLPDGLGGLYGSVQVNADEGVAGSKHTGAQLGYLSGAFQTSAAFGTTKVAYGERFNVFAVGASYDFGVVKLMGEYIDQRTGVVDQFHTDGGQRTALVGVQIPVGVGWINLAYTAARGRQYFEGLKADQFAAGYVYNFSRRTALYTYASHLRNKGSAGYAVGPFPAVGATTVGADGAVHSSAMAGRSSSGIEFGMRHKF